MSEKSEIHPDVILQTLLEKGGRSQRVANLKKIHELCRLQYEAKGDFSLPTVGRLIEAQNIMKGRALYNAASADYKLLIETWGSFSGPPVQKPQKTLSSYEYLMRIDDPAIRSLMQAIISERDKLKAQLNVLKAHSKIVVDRRPSVEIPAIANNAPTAVVFSLTTLLTDSEHEALKKATNPHSLEEKGLLEGSHGEVFNDRGRVLFDVGFTHAIRKILGGTARL